MSDIKAVFRKNTSYNIRFRVTRWCNYNCEYCIQNNNKIYIPQELVEQRAEKINKIISELDNEDISLSLIGGEISFYNLVNILNKFDLSRIASVKITSNFAGPIENFNNVTKLLLQNKVRFNLILSFHETQTNLDDFINKLKLLENRKKIKLQVEMVITPQNHKIGYDLLNICKELKIYTKFDIDRTVKDPDIISIFATKGKKLYNIYDENNTFMEWPKIKMIDTIRKQGINDWYCSNSYTHITIDEDNIYGTCCNEKELVGTLDTGFTKKLRTCSNGNTCACVFISISKYKEDMNKYLKSHGYIKQNEKL